ncbi:PAS domain S-box protein [Algoriphagus boritolerans]|uniref:histidine kinase n=2 Tax=Algoriphagus TaxID=246875 RepID=A0A1H5VMM0_9BACT|nr:PAS domain S-box protein [Algoriphagus boritolerans]SEF88585.1 PAS domain S-box-containing protein [Algoriphagus boritolerans DSM 17298 = JCM 18970]
MTHFQQFDISDFFNEIQEPLFLMDSEDILFFNRFFLENFNPISDNWKLFFDSPELTRALDDFFRTGSVPSLRISKSLLSKAGSLQQFDWGFINLPSSYNSRFLIAKGTESKGAVTNKATLGRSKGEVISGELRYMQSILNNSHDMIAILDKDGNYKFISDSVTEKLGFVPAEIIGKNFRDFAALGSIEIVKGDFYEALRTKEEVAIDFWVKLRDGKRIYLESFAKNLLDHPQIHGIIFSSRDVTEYVQTEKSLQRRYEIENLIIHLSARIIGGNFSEMESEFFVGLARFGDFLDASHAEILVFNKETEVLEALTSWSSSKVENSKLLPDNDELKLIFENQSFLEKGKVRLITSEIGPDRAVRSLKNSRILIPMISGNKLLGLIRFESGPADFPFEEKEIQVLRQLGDVLAGSYLGSLMNRKIERNENLLTQTEMLSKSGSWRYSTFKNRFYCSGGFANLFGLGSKPISEEFSSLIFRIDKPFRSEFVKNLRKASKELSRTSGEFTISDSLGKTKHLSYEIEGKRELFTQGLEVYGFCTDITHLRASDSYLRLQSQILAQVSDPILVTNLELEVIYLNEAAIQLCCPETARDYEGFLGDLVTIYWNSDEKLVEICQDLQVGEVKNLVRNIQTKHTHYSPFEISIQAIHAEGKEKIGYSVILRGLEEKHKSEQIAKRAQLIVENSPAVLFRVDPNDNYKIHYISENINLFGYDASDLVQKGTSFLDLLHPEDKDILLEYSKNKLLKVGIPSFSGEYRIRTSLGEIVWVEDRTRDIFSDSGEILLHEGLFQDISDRKNLEILKSQRDEQYRVLASNIPETNIFLLDKERRYILAEGTNFEKWGLRREDFEGKKLSEFQLTPYEEINAILDRVYFNQEIVVSEFLFNERHYNRTIRPIVENGQVEYALSIVRDIQDEFQAKKDLQQSEEKYRRLVEDSTEIIFSLTEAFLLHYVSPNVKQFLDYDSEEVIGRSIFDFINPDDLGVFQEMLGEEKDFLAQNQFLEFRLRHKNGEYRVFSSNGKLIEDKEGIHRYYTGVARDISKLKETQKELLLAKEKAEQASQIKSQFLSVMSHEIRTPMNAVIGLAHFLMEEDPRPDQLENLKTLQFSAENLMALINDILDYNKIDSGKVELELAPFDIRNITHRIVHSHSFQANEKSLKISCEIDEAIPQTLIGDSLRIGQIVNNLVSNAIKFTETGFVRISISREFTNGNHTDIKFVFEDTGIGIPENKRKSIFEAFTQASSSTSRKYGGTGLGLAIVKRLVELQGGEIEVRPRKGGGSIFEFVISYEFVDSRQLETDRAGKLAKHRSLENTSILVAEDNAVNQILIRKFLTKWAVGNLIITSDGKQALEQFNYENFDLVLLDLQMPELDGFEVAKAIRNHPDPQKSAIPILALTAASLNEIKEEMKASGMNDFVPKPFTPELLYEKILKYLNPKDQVKTEV